MNVDVRLKQDFRDQESFLFSNRGLGEELLRHKPLCETRVNNFNVFGVDYMYFDFPVHEYVITFNRRLRNIS